MTDEDVVRKVAALLGVAYRKRDRKRPNTQLSYHVRLTGRRAVQLMQLLVPHLSARRQAQVARALAGVEPAWLTGPSFAFRAVCTVGVCVEAPDQAAPDPTRCAQHQP